MTLRDEYEPISGTLLHRSPLPSLDVVIKDLLSEETRLKTLRDERSLLSTDVVLVTPGTFVASSISSKSSKQTFCNYYKKTGHTISECRRLQAKKASGQKSSYVGSQASSSIAATATEDSSDNTSPKFSFRELQALLHQLQPASGTISTPRLSLPNTFLVPQLSLNLISVGQLCELGLEIHFSSRGRTVQDPQTGKIIGTGRKVGRLFELSSLQLPSLVVAITSSVWHARLGHISTSRLGSLIYNGCLGPVKTTHFDCVFCPLSKHHALPFNTSDYVSSAPFDLIHSDIWGPSPRNTMGGSRPTTSSSDSSNSTTQPTTSPTASTLVVDPPALASSEPLISPDEFDSDRSDAPLRRSGRVTKPFVLRDFHCYSTIVSLYEPCTYCKASTDPLWQKAMVDEIQALTSTHTWDLVDLPPDKSVIGCKWVYKIKTRADGSIERYKARLVAKGFTQEYGIDYDETFASVARLTSVRSLIAIVAAKHS
ncbi:PREDICTED: uncharacterized protein LOC104607033 [Nelumbo nucifera]|uniref:Uncharacterized protein LOC104607033 n=1 Tax=Nelumbo nucifera TaxID=4432 RepID=A0A1U8ASM9_NELNU|nr:PREDICTED: uncharacterized protein LOC104607033 [Nelumbo nucifera]